MHVLMLTRRVDRDDWLAGFAHSWVTRLAAHPRIEQLDVICLELGRTELPPNVRVASMGKERGAGRPARWWAFQRAIAPVIRQADVIFSHMIPRYALMAAPWALCCGVPIVQWYTHRQVTLELRLVHALAARVVTASPESFTLPSRKLTVLGHGIDLRRFQPAPQPAAERLIVAVGRLSPIKHYEALLAAAAELTHRPGYEDVRIAIAGGTTPQDGQPYADRLRALADALGVSDRVSFLGPVPHQDVPALYGRASLTVNLCPTGGVDKAVLESLACAVPAVVRNATFRPLLGDAESALWIPDPEPAALADRFAALLDADPQERRALGERLAARVRAAYGLDDLIDRLVRVFEQVMGREPL